MRLAISVVVCLLSWPVFAQSPYFEHNRDVDPESEPDFSQGFFADLGDFDASVALTEDSETDEALDLYGPNEDLRAFGIDDLAASVDTLVLWQECQHMQATGNYTGYDCSNRRVIGDRLLVAFEEHLIGCINEGLAAQGGGTAAKVHVEHAGIMADFKHSPKSNHSIGRAVDIKRISVSLQSGGQRTFSYAKTGNRPFYTALRACWGKVMMDWNGCPLYGGNIGHTASIGWEDKRHGQHLHLSVPICSNGQHLGPQFAK